MTADDEVKQIAAQVAEAQARLGSLSKVDPQREAVKVELSELLATLARKKEEGKRDNALRNCAGLQSPLAEAMRARLDPGLVVELESDAIERQRERDRIGAERRSAKEAERAAKTAAPPPPPEPPKPLSSAPRPAPRGRGMREVEVVVLARRAGGSLR